MGKEKSDFTTTFVYWTRGINRWAKCISKEIFWCHLFEACHRLHSAYARFVQSWRSIAILCSILVSCFIPRVPFTRDGNSIAKLSNVGTRGVAKEFHQAISIPTKGKLHYFVIQRNLFKKVLKPFCHISLLFSKIRSVRSRDWGFTLVLHIHTVDRIKIQWRLCWNSNWDPGTSSTSQTLG